MLWRLARSSKKALPEKCRRCSEGREVKPLWDPTGTKPGERVGGREGCVWSLEARQGLGGRGNGHGPRLCLDSGFAPGPASRRRLTSLRFGRPGRRAELAADVPVPHVGALDLSGSAACRCLGFGFLLRALGSLPSRTLTADPPPCLPPAFTCSWSGQKASRPGPRRRVRNVAQWVRNLFPPPPLRSPERRWASESRDRASGGRVAGGSRDESRVGRHCHSLSGPGRAALRQPAARGRVGGRMGRGLGE